jgi:hypothetical protein
MVCAWLARLCSFAVISTALAEDFPCEDITDCCGSSPDCTFSTGKRCSHVSCDTTYTNGCNYQCSTDAPTPSPPTPPPTYEPTETPPPVPSSPSPSDDDPSPSPSGGSLANTTSTSSGGSSSSTIIYGIVGAIAFTGLLLALFVRQKSRKQNDARHSKLDTEMVYRPPSYVVGN